MKEPKIVKKKNKTIVNKRKSSTKKSIKKTAKSQSLFRRLLGSFSNKHRIAIGLIVIAVIAAFILPAIISGDGTAAQQRLKENPAKGVVYKGMKVNPKSKLCKGDKLLEVTDKKGVVQGCSHGPDPAPGSVDVRGSVQEYATEVSSYTPPSFHGVICDGDGSSGNRVEALYVYASDKPNRFLEYERFLRAGADIANDLLIESSWQTGKTLSYRFVHDASCEAVIKTVKLSPTGDDTLGNTISELKALGYNRTDRKYLMWVDANVYCGVAGMYLDDRVGQENANNSGPSYARVDNGCWARAVEGHELMHSLGGVQPTAPHSTAYGHCTDEADMMCYQDSASTVLQSICPNEEEIHFDCNKDDYFHTHPPSGSYLSNFWNTANNKFLFAPNIPVPAEDTIPPRVSITSPQNGSTIKNSVKVTGNATDDVYISKVEIFVDGQLRSISGGGEFSARINFAKLTKGSHTITAKAHDRHGNVSSANVTVTK